MEFVVVIAASYAQKASLQTITLSVVTRW